MSSLVLSRREKALGSDHPDTLSALHEWTVTTVDLGDWITAEQVELEVLRKRQDLLGIHHPDVAHSRLDLATTYRHLGHLGKAIEHMRKHWEFKRVFTIPTLLSC